MKKAFTLILSAFIAITFAGCKETPKDDIFTLVEKRYDDIIDACEKKDADTLLSVNGIEKVNVVDGYVIVLCISEGISVSSHDHGFYYSENDVPSAVDCNLDIIRSSDILVSDGNGYSCVVGGNTFYTEKIKGNIYFYCNQY